MTVVIRPARRASARAADPPPPVAAPPTVLGEIVVTAEKRETLLSSAASGLTAVSGAELARQDVQDVHDLSLLSAGVTVTNLGPGRNKVLLRGLSDGPLTGHTQSTVGIYLGELRLTYNAPDPGLPFLDIARLEVLRGPQGSLYGAGSIGGVLHIVPNAPDPAGRSGRLDAALSVTAHGAPSQSVSGVFNQPLGDDAAARAVVWSDRAGGYIDDAQRGRADVDRTRRMGARVSGLWRPTDRLSLDAVVIGQTIDTRDAHYAQGADGTLTRRAAAAEPHDNDYLAVAATARLDLDGARLTATLAALDHDVSSTYDAGRAPLSLVVAGDRPATFEDGNEIRQTLSEVRLASTGQGPLRWVVGAFAAYGEQRLDAEMTGASGRPGYVEVRRDRLIESAVFGEASYDLTRDLSLTVGGRLFGNRLSAASTVSVGAPVRRFDDRLTDGGFAPKLRLAWRLSPRASVYVAASEGYRTGGFNTGGPPGQLFSAAEPGAQPFRRYGGDELWSYEAGGRWRSADGQIVARAAAFLADWRDIQADLILPSGLAYTADFGDGRSLGVEAEATWEVGALTLAGNFVWQDAELVRHGPALALEEANLPGIPGVSLGVSAAYTLDLAPEWSLDVAAGYTYVGRSRLTFDGLTAPEMGDYGDLRLSATLAHGPWGLGLAVDNALDTHGDTLAFGNPFTFRAAAQHTPQRPRSVRASLSRRF